MITLTTGKFDTLSFKRNGVKYIAKFSNFDKKFVFKREFINGFSYDLHTSNALLEVAFSNGDKKYFEVNVKEKQVNEVSYDYLKKMKEANAQEMCYKYFM